MFRKFGFLCAALALFSIAGGQWGMWQTVAWAGMLRDYNRRTGNIATAVEQTFDGQHPCELCREIQRAKSKEHHDSSSVPSRRSDAKVKALAADPVLLAFVRTAEEFSLPCAPVPASSGRTEQPPTPPPRRGTLAA